ncbi:MAG: Maf family protein [Actinomycetota bacterium]
MPRLVLASASPRRALLLSTAGFAIDIRPPDITENVIDGETAAETVLRLAHLKAKAVDRATDEVVLAADTMVVLDGIPLGKPRDATDAARMLSALSGRTHSVLTGWLAIADDGERFDIAESRVTFKELAGSDIDAYINDTRPFDKAGAYGIQEEKGRLIEHVNGSRANVMGLPLREIVAALEEFGVVPSGP